MINHWSPEGFTSHQYFGIGGFGDIETYVSSPSKTIEAVAGGVNPRNIKFEDIKPVWKQNEEKKDWIDKVIKRETLKLHKPDIINVSETIDEQIREIYQAQAVKQRIKKKRKNKAMAMLLMGM